MAQTYRSTSVRRTWNRVAMLLISAGMGSARWRVLTVRGRTSGREYRTPVSLLRHDGRDWLVSPHGRRGWAANALAAGEVTLRRGGDTRTFRVHEVEPERAAPILRAYLHQEPITRPYFDVTLDSAKAEFIAEAPRHPVFALEDAGR